MDQTVYGSEEEKFRAALSSELMLTTAILSSVSIGLAVLKSMIGSIFGGLALITSLLSLALPGLFCYLFWRLYSDAKNGRPLSPVLRVGGGFCLSETVVSWVICGGSALLFITCLAFGDIVKGVVYDYIGNTGLIALLNNWAGELVPFISGALFTIMTVLSLCYAVYYGVFAVLWGKTTDFMKTMKESCETGRDAVTRVNFVSGFLLVLAIIDCLGALGSLASPLNFLSTGAHAAMLFVLRKLITERI